MGIVEPMVAEMIQDQWMTEMRGRGVEILLTSLVSWSLCVLDSRFQPHLGLWILNLH